MCSGDVSSKHAECPLSALHPLCPMAGVYSRDQISNKKPRLAVIVIASQQWTGAGAGQTLDQTRVSGDIPGLSSSSWVWHVTCDGVRALSIQTSPLIFSARCSVLVPGCALCWVTINNISLQSKLIFTSEYEHCTECDTSPRIDTCDPAHPEYCVSNTAPLAANITGGCSV